MILSNTAGFVSDLLMKRAGDTPDAPAPEQPPQDNHSNLPKIGGSFGGFIALVVCLAAIVVFSCIAIYILLHQYHPDPYERHFRKTMFGKRETSVYEAPLGPQGMRDKFKNLIGRGKKSEGWVRANNDDEEWDSSDRNLGAGGTRGLGEADATQVGSPFSPPRPPHASSLRREPTSESIELSVPSDPHAPATGPASTYADPFASPPLPNSPSTYAEAEGQPTPHEEAGHGRFSVQSGDNGTIRSMRKFDGGTKFKEAIDFQ